MDSYLAINLLLSVYMTPLLPWERLSHRDPFCGYVILLNILERLQIQQRQILVHGSSRNPSPNLNCFPQPFGQQATLDDQYTVWSSVVTQRHRVRNKVRDG